jgi:hypothetical protein
MKKTKQPKPKKADPVENKPEQEFTEVFETPLQNRMNSFWYRVIATTETFYLTVIASCSSDAQVVVKQQYPDAAINFLGKSEKIIQVG